MLGVFHLVLGCLDLLYAAVAGCGGVINALEDPLLGIFMGFYGLGIGAVGLLNLAAGVALQDLRGRTLSIVAALAGISTLLGMICAGPSAGLLIFCLVVVMNPDAMAAFRQRAEGMPAADVLRGAA